MGEIVENMTQVMRALSIEKGTHQCEHSTFINNACASCNKIKHECDNPATIKLHYIEPQFSVTDEAITRLRDRNFDSLVKRKKLHLVLDLDNTLIHASNVGQELGSLKKDDVYEILYGMYLIKLRPGVRDFLKEASFMFDISICTMADHVYAEAVTKMLRSKVASNFRFTRVVCQEHYTKSNKKALDIELSHERVVLIVDDTEQVWSNEHKANLIKIKPYVFFNQECPVEDDDQELAKVLDLLKKVHTAFYDDKEQNYASKDVKKLLESIKIIE